MNRFSELILKQLPYIHPGKQLTAWVGNSHTINLSPELLKRALEGGPVEREQVKQCIAPLQLRDFLHAWAGSKCESTCTIRVGDILEAFKDEQP